MKTIILINSANKEDESAKIITTQFAQKLFLENKLMETNVKLAMIKPSFPFNTDNVD